MRLEMCRAAGVSMRGIQLKIYGAVAVLEWRVEERELGWGGDGVLRLIKSNRSVNLRRVTFAKVWIVRSMLALIKSSTVM